MEGVTHGGSSRGGSMAYDELEHRWRQWCSRVESRQVTEAMRAHVESIGGLTRAFEAFGDDDDHGYSRDPSSNPAAVTPPPYRYPASTAELRGLASVGHGTSPLFYTSAAQRAFGTSLSEVWKHWKHFVLLRRHRPNIAGGLIDEEVVVVCWKHWRRAAAGRPLIHDIEAVVCWKHWKLFHAMGAERRGKAEAMGLRLKAGRQAEARRRDEEAMRAERKKNLAEQRKQRRDEDWGFSIDDDDYTLYGDGGGEGGEGGKGGKENNGSNTPSAGKVGGGKRDGDGGGGGGETEGEVPAEDAAAASAATAPPGMDFATFSHTVVCWKRWRGFTKMRRHHKVGLLYKLNPVDP
jgi:hypothetical protein